MKTVELTERTMERGSLILINSGHPLSDAAPPRCLPASPDAPDILLEARTATCLGQLLASVNGQREITAVSGYRSAQEQRQIYENSLAENGPDFTRKYVAKPGCSEHQSGLAIDLAKRADDIDFLCPDFPDSGVCGDLRGAASRYGFVQRYASDKETLTGIACEPWHFRFVGYPHAVIMERLNLCLEEYLYYLRRFPWGGNPLQFTSGGRVIEIYWASGFGQIGLPDHRLAEVSGTNTGGHVITLWQ